MSELSAPQQIWLSLFQKFLEKGINNLDELSRLEALSHLLLRSIPATEAQTLIPVLSTNCAICHVQGQPDGPRCAEHLHTLTDGTVLIYMSAEGSGVGLCGDCAKRVEQLTAEAKVQNPKEPLYTDAAFESIRLVN
ncbi:MAG: hypothetical protein WCC22_07540 [Terriglobales bacterium]